MVVRPATFVLLTTLAAAAAGAGGWLAVRQNSADAVSGDMAPALPGSPGCLAPVAVAAADPAVAPAPPTPPTPVAAAAKPVSATAPEPHPPVVREPAAPAESTAPSETAVTPAESGETAETATAAVSEALPDSPPTASDPTLETAAGADRSPVEAPRTVPGPDAAWRAAASELPRVDGWVRSTKSAAPAVPVLQSVDQLVIGADSVIGLQVETSVSSAASAVEDDVDARVTRDVMVGDRVAIPAGTRVRGSVVLVEQAGKLQGTPRLGVRFHTALMDDGAELPLSTETVYREGPARGSESTRRIGGAAVGGAILGAIFGGRRGAAIGSAAGAAGGTALAVAHDGPPASFPAGAAVTIRLLNPATVRVDRLRPGSR